MININEIPLQGFNAWVKRGLDIVLSAAAMVLLAIPFAIISALVKWTSPGPIFYKQERMGLDGKAFTVYKFRSMHEDAENATGPIWAGDDEPIIVYTEPIGVAWKKEGDEYSSKLVVDFEIRSPDGQVLAGQRGFGEFELDAREPPLDYMSHIKLDVTGAPEGSYILGITIHDTNSGKSATTDLPFEIK